jgi:hypothetical protein
VLLARAELATATDRLILLEREAGGDVAELRLLTEFVGGESNLRSAITAVKNDLRQARVLKANYQQLLHLLRKAENDPNQLLAAPSELLASQPALQRLKDGLIESQLAAARQQGTMTEEHPLVKAALLAQAAICKNMHGEIAVALRGIEAEMELADVRIATLNEQMTEAEGRMDRLTHLRAHYANAASEVRHCDEMLKESQQDLTAARASLAAAHASSLLTRLEEPYTPDDPCGPRKAMILLAGLLGGLAAGLGLVFLLPSQPPLAGASPVADAPQTASRENGLLMPSRPQVTYAQRHAAPAAEPEESEEPVRRLNASRISQFDRNLSLKQALAHLLEQ